MRPCVAGRLAAAAVLLAAWLWSTSRRLGPLIPQPPATRRSMVEHVAASGSLPPSFPMTRSGDDWYWDGGLFSNTPLSPAINALEEAADGDSSAVRELIVVELFPMRAAIPRSLDDGTAFGRACDRDAAAAAELQQPLVAKEPQRPEHGVRIDTEDGG